MIKFSCSRTSEDMTPVIRDIDISKFAEKVLYDYRPELLNMSLYGNDPFFEPELLNPYDFAEHYLGADIEVHDIYTESSDEVIAGAAIFNRQKVKVFDREKQRTRNITVDPNTIILDTETVDKWRHEFEFFTIMHEAGHLMLHQKVYRNEPEENKALCMRSNIGRSRGDLRTSEDFREHQANTFAASMLMPPRVFIPYVQAQMQKNRRFREEGIMATYDFAWGDARYGYYLEIANRTSRQFGVSSRAVKVQMAKYGLRANPKEADIKEACRRLKMYQSLYRY